jgi:cystathionine gamma-synthase
MRGFGGLVTFLVKEANHRQTADVVDALHLPRIGPSLGGVESIVEQPIVMSYHDFTLDQRRAVGILDNMIRISCGVENTEDLIADLDQALGRAH